MNKGFMRNYKYIILGAGPSGLALAHRLLERGETSFLVIEKEEVAGGLCRSEMVDGTPLDIGGGHFLDLKRKEVLDLLFKFLPESEWMEYVRDSKIHMEGSFMDYPFESNLWQLPVDEQVEYLKSISQAGCISGAEMPQAFSKWIRWKLGDRIADKYMLPYNRKIWSMDLDDLGTYWLYKLPDVSFEEVLRSCLEKSQQGTIPAHGKFLYPKKYGYGEVWKRMGQALGDRILLGEAVESLDLEQRIVNGKYQGEQIISSIPWSVWQQLANIESTELNEAIGSLKHISVDVDYVEEEPHESAHWIYEPDETLSYHRILCRSNFYEGAKGSWTETNSKRAGEAKGFRHRNDYAYPLNTKDKPEKVSKILEWFGERGVIGMGRWGKWEHMNSDVAVSEGILLADELLAAR